MIHTAFQDACYPGDDHLAGKVSQCPSEYAYVAAYFKGKHWTEIMLKGLRENYPGPPDACLSFMSPEAFRFYLPAYMVMAVTEEASDDNTVDSAEDALTPPKADPRLYELANAVGDSSTNPFRPEAIEHQKTWWEQRIVGLTQAQQQAIVVFLGYLASRWIGPPQLGPQGALAYWKRRVGG